MVSIYVVVVYWVFLNEIFKKNDCFFYFRFEVVRIEIRGDCKEFVKMLMVKGMMYVDRNN